MKKTLQFGVIAALLAAAALIAQTYQVPVWNGKQYLFPRLGPTLSLANSQLDAVIPAPVPGPAGPQGPQGPAGPQGPTGTGVPYSGATQDLDLNGHTLTAGAIILNSFKPTAVGFIAGPPPADTTVNGQVCDAVLFFDSADLKLKLRKKSGQIVQIEMTP